MMTTCERTVVQVQICYTENVNIYSSFNDIYIAEVNQALLAWSFRLQDMFAEGSVSSV